MARWSALLLASCVWLSGCASIWRVDSDVQSFSTLGAVAPGTAIRFDRLPSQQADAATQNALEALATPALAQVGLVPGPTPRFSVELGMQTLVIYPDTGRWGPGPLWYGPGRWGWPGRPQLWMPEPTRYQHQLKVVLRALDSGQVVFESRAVHEGFGGRIEDVLPAMFQAALQGFPNPPAGLRTVSIQPPQH
ncbi:MAG: hypothetical protein NTZ15_16800 [Burkholderiales bacterium]|nr:hypothetical protein [Burkholderiales bacterium]